MTSTKVEKGRSDIEELGELVRTLIIVQLGLAGVPQRNIRAILRCDLNLVTRISKQLKVRELPKS